MRGQKHIGRHHDFPCTVSIVHFSVALAKTTKVHMGNLETRANCMRLCPCDITSITKTLEYGRTPPIRRPLRHQAVCNTTRPFIAEAKVYRPIGLSFILHPLLPRLRLLLFESPKMPPPSTPISRCRAHLPNMLPQVLQHMPARASLKVYRDECNVGFAYWPNGILPTHSVKGPFAQIDVWATSLKAIDFVSSSLLTDAVSSHPNDLSGRNIYPVMRIDSE